MSGVTGARVSRRGQLSLPAVLRRRWGIEDGGEITFLDLGTYALVLSCTPETAKQEVRRALVTGGYDAGLAALDDPDIAVQ